ncbi:MAG: hypothetical protein ACO2OS_03665 [Thermosphaera aggregans]
MVNGCTSPEITGIQRVEREASTGTVVETSGFEAPLLPLPASANTKQ